MEIRKSKTEEVKILTEISKNAFLSDIYLNSPEPVGPPDFDSEEWHQEMINSGNLFSIIDDNKLIGGLIIFRDENQKNIMYLGRIFIDTKLHRTGYGEKAMLLLEKLYPDIEFWKLDTPIWNKRTNNFYIKLGYTETNRDNEFIYYQKQIKK